MSYNNIINNILRQEDEDTIAHEGLLTATRHNY